MFINFEQLKQLQKKPKKVLAWNFHSHEIEKVYLYLYILIIALSLD